MKNRRRIHMSAAAALAPATILFLTVYVACTLYSVFLSMTSSKLLPNHDFVGLTQYVNLLNNARWHGTVANVSIYGPLFILSSLLLGMLLAIFIDQRIRGEALIRSLILYPYATSLIVTGLLWNWLFDPAHGIGEVLRFVGFGSVTGDWMVNEDTVLFTLVVAAVWHAAGLVMALTLAGLRGIDDEIWKALSVDGVPKWRGYAQVIVPMLGTSIASSVVLLAIGVVKVYDLVVAMTRGGPGYASDMPAKFVMNNFFERQNVGLATAGATLMLITVVVLLVPFYYMQKSRSRPA